MDKASRDGMDTMVSLRGVSRRYVRGGERVEALRDVDLEIAAGTFVALIGPTGAGKTTLLNLIAGLDTPHAGSVCVAGERIDTLGPRELAEWRAEHVGLVLYVDHLLPTLSIERNVEIPLLARPLSRYERRREVLAALDDVGLLRSARSLPASLSPAQRRRVGIARALVTRPNLLVCDEPTSNLGGANADDILDVLYDSSARLGMTIVMATDDVLASEWASRVIVIDDGRLAPAPRAQAAA
jgi:putative ABC transport system ATP-binding protein